MKNFLASHSKLGYTKSMRCKCFMFIIKSVALCLLLGIQNASAIWESGIGKHPTISDLNEVKQMIGEKLGIPALYAAIGKTAINAAMKNKEIEAKTKVPAMMLELNKELDGSQIYEHEAQHELIELLKLDHAASTSSGALATLTLALDDFILILTTINDWQGLLPFNKTALGKIITGLSQLRQEAQPGHH